MREDGMVFDDGTTARLGDQHFLMTTTTANAAKGLTMATVLLRSCSRMPGMNTCWRHWR